MKTKRRFTNCFNLRFFMSGLLGFAVLLVLDFAFLPQLMNFSYADEPYVTDSVTLKLSPTDTTRSDYYLSFTKPDPTYGSFGTVGINANVATANSYGYSLYLRTDSNEGRLLPALSVYGRNQYISTITQSYAVTDSSGTGFDEMNKYGWSTNWNPATGRGTFNPMQTTDMKIKNAVRETYAQGSCDPTTQTTCGEDTLIYIGAKLNDKVMSGTYHGTLIFTAIANSSPVYDTYTLSYDMNGGDYAPSTFPDQTITTTAQDPTATFTINTNIPTRSGRTFLGWDVNRDAVAPAFVSDGSTVTPGTITPSSTNTTLYAIWSSAPAPTMTMAANPTYTYILNYDSVGGSDGPTTAVKYSSNTSETIAIDSRVPTKDGNTFKGWAFSQNSSSADLVYDSVAGTFTPSTVSFTSTQATKTVYAVWETTNETVHTANEGNAGAQGVITYENDNTLEAIIAVGAGIVVATSSFVILFIAKRKKEENDELNVDK